MAKNQLPTQDELKRLLRYDPATGKLFWKRRSVTEFTTAGHSAAHTCAKWNSRWAYKEALTKLNLGYRCGRLNYQYVLAHRVIWKLVTGEEPTEIDHINGDRGDNRWANLRNVNSTLNRRNSARRSDNKSGVTGVFFRKDLQKWQATITLAGKNVYIGLFETFDQAVSWRKAEEGNHSFHPNHGREAKEK